MVAEALAPYRNAYSAGTRLALLIIIVISWRWRQAGDKIKARGRHIVKISMYDISYLAAGAILYVKGSCQTYLWRLHFRGGRPRAVAWRWRQTAGSSGEVISRVAAHE